MEVLKFILYIFILGIQVGYTCHLVVLVFTASKKLNEIKEQQVEIKKHLNGIENQQRSLERKINYISYEIAKEKEQNESNQTLHTSIW